MTSETNRLRSYPSVYALGHSAIAGLLEGEVVVEEKIDGSQFSFLVTESGEIGVRSKGAEINLDAPEKMFAAAIHTVKELAATLHPGWTYRCEYLQKPKHNAVAYSRIPSRNLIIFDINTGHEEYLLDRANEAARIGLECVPLLFRGFIQSPEQIKSFLDRESVLGGQEIEGVVIKPADYGLFGRDKKVLMGKFVSEKFKETQKKEWRIANPAGKDVLAVIGDSLCTEARWLKSVQHLREIGTLEDSPRDIGPLLKEAWADIAKECQGEIMATLWKWACPHLKRKAVHGLPEWYKRRLLERQFEKAGIAETGAT